MVTKIKKFFSNYNSIDKASWILLILGWIAYFIFIIFNVSTSWYAYIICISFWGLTSVLMIIKFIIILRIRNKNRIV